MDDVAVRVDGLGKKYHLGAPQARYSTLRDQIHKWVSLRGLLRRAARAETRPEFWALKDVSFEVKPGEVVGIIGRNGAGKSTLLKILSRITEPTEGGADVHGRVGSLLEVGTGFNPELTGRENVFLNGAILGMRRAEIARKFDAIVAFAEVEKFIDTAVKHYSSGMYTRLAFAVAAHLEPEILIVDEVLAVGDAEFQQKCLGKMSEVSRGGRTILFVSHQMAAVQKLCTRCLLMERGRVAMSGTSDEVVRAYLNAGRRDDGQFNAAGRQVSSHVAEVVDAWLEQNGTSTSTLLHGDTAELILHIHVKEAARFSVDLILRQQDGTPIAFCPSESATGWLVDMPPGRIRVRCRLPAVPLGRGEYSIDVNLAVTGVMLLDRVESALRFTIASALVGPKNWDFVQGPNSGAVLWDVQFALADE
jgi:lipopolysaccharide transport system ATP-binding protein